MEIAAQTFWEVTAGSHGVGTVIEVIEVTEPSALENGVAIVKPLGAPDSQKARVPLDQRWGTGMKQVHACPVCEQPLPGPHLGTCRFSMMHTGKPELQSEVPAEPPSPTIPSEEGISAEPGKPLDTAAATAELTKAMAQIGDLMQTPDKQERAIELWEKLWHVEVPNMARRSAELATAIDGLGRPMTEEELADIAPVLRQVADLVGAVTSDKAPNPQIVAIYYLRRIEQRLVDIGEDMNVRFSIDEERRQ